MRTASTTGENYVNYTMAVMSMMVEVNEIKVEVSLMVECPSYYRNLLTN